LWLSHTPTRLGTMEHVLKELEHSNAENNSIAAFKQGDEGDSNRNLFHLGVYSAMSKKRVVSSEGVLKFTLHSLEGT